MRPREVGLTRGELARRVLNAITEYPDHHDQRDWIGSANLHDELYAEQIDQIARTALGFPERQSPRWDWLPWVLDADRSTQDVIAFLEEYVARHG